MVYYFLLRVLLPGLLFIGWIIYQLVYKNKPWAAVKDDALAVAFFVIVWIGLAYFFTS